MSQRRTQAVGVHASLLIAHWMLVTVCMPPAAHCKHATGSGWALSAQVSKQPSAAARWCKSALTTWWQRANGEACQ